jgi:hypothetical protein
MEVAIAFIAAWIIRHAWESKSDEFRAEVKAEQQRIKMHSPSTPKTQRKAQARRVTRRKATGWGLYQLRHGWPSLWTTVRDGWNEARRQHEAWLAANPRNPKGRSRWRLVEAMRAGWAHARDFANQKRAAAARRFKKGDTPKQPEIPTTTTTTATATADQPVIIPAQSATGGHSATRQHNTNGRIPMSNTGEAGGYAESQALADEYAQSLANTQSVLEQYEASLLSGGLGKDPAVIGTLASAQESIGGAAAAFQQHKQGLNGHQQGAEYAAEKGAAAANTDWLGNQ